MNKEFDKLYEQFVHNPSSFKVGSDLIETKNNLGETLFHYFVIENCIEYASILLNLGAKIDTVDNYHRTPLQNTAILGNSEMLRWLLKNGADPCYQHGESGETALFYSLSHNHHECSKILLENENVDPNQLCKSGRSLSMSIAYSADQESYRLLHEAGAKIFEYKNSVGLSAISELVTYDNYEVLKYLLTTIEDKDINDLILNNEFHSILLDNNKSSKLLFEAGLTGDWTGGFE